MTRKFAYGRYSSIVFPKEKLLCSFYSHFILFFYVKKYLGTVVNHPLLGDATKEIARAYDVLLQKGDGNGLAVRGLFIVGKDGKVRCEMRNDLVIEKDLWSSLKNAVKHKNI